MPPSIPKLLSRSLATAAAALLMHVGAAGAADGIGNIPRSTKSLPVESINARSAYEPPAQNRKSANRGPDAQELARRLLSGSSPTLLADARRIAPETAVATPEVEHGKRAFAYGDPQAAAQQLLLGQHPTDLVSATGKRKSEKHPADYGDPQAAVRQMLLGEHPEREASPRTERATR